MVINPVNSISFKAIYEKENSKFSDSQNRVAKNIHDKLGSMKDKEDFLIQPAKNDSVEFYHLGGLKKEGKGCDKHITYQFLDLIGRYDEQHPFESKDFDLYLKEATEHIYGAIVMGLLAIGMMFGGLYFSATKKADPKSTEKAMTVAKDSVQNIVKDSLKIFK